MTCPDLIDLLARVESGRQPPGDLDAHLEECKLCAKQFAMASASLDPRIDDESHVPVEELEALLHNSSTIPQERTGALWLHIAGCSSCRDDLHLLREFDSAGEPPDQPPLLTLKDVRRIAHSSLPDNVTQKLRDGSALILRWVEDQLELVSTAFAPLPAPAFRADSNNSVLRTEADLGPIRIAITMTPKLSGEERLCSVAVEQVGERISTGLRISFLKENESEPLVELGLGEAPRPLGPWPPGDFLIQLRRGDELLGGLSIHIQA